MPLLIEPTKPAPLVPPLGRHCVLCGVALKGTKHHRYCGAHKDPRKSMWERKNRTRRRVYWRQWKRDKALAKRQEGR